ncbi:MAG: hypothetical protein ACOYH4_01485 [Saccharofermentanales bacterium]|jgi:cell division septum initiation protein DivIVA
MNDYDDRRDMQEPDVPDPPVGPPRVREERSVATLLKRMEAEVENAKNVPFSDRCMVDREEMLYLIRMVNAALPEELEQARWVLQQNRQLTAQARREAETIRRDAEVQMARMIDEHEITQQAINNAQVMMDDATRQSNEIRANAIAYTREMLTNLEEHLTDILVNITRNKKELE